MSIDGNKVVVADDTVVRMDYKLTVDGEVLDSSEGEAPLEFLQGHKNIIPGLERELYGMAPGESKAVQIAARNGYGEVDPEEIVDINRDEFPSEIPLKVGVSLQVRDTDDHVMNATIVKVAEDTIQLDFNHPLAGKDLYFEVTIVSVRPASEEEVAHGHVHGPEGH